MTYVVRYDDVVRWVCRGGASCYVASLGELGGIS